MQNRNVGAKTRADSPDHLRSQGDFRNQNNHTAAKINGQLGTLEINFGFAASGNAKKKVLFDLCHALTIRGQRLADRPDGVGLIRGR